MNRRRWRQPALTRPTLALALISVVMLHALFALLLLYTMQPRQPHQASSDVARDQPLMVHLIARSSTPAPAPPPAPSALPKLMSPQRIVTPRAQPVTHEKSHPDAMVMQDHQARPAPAASVATPSAVSLFAKDGSIRLPPTTAGVSAATKAEAKPAKPADDRQIMQHDSNQMHYKATRFEKYFPPPNETAGGAVGRHIGDALKAMGKSLCDPSKASPASFALCGAPPLPPSSKNRDERLNLPPPPLADDPVPTKTLPLSTCIATYKADKPLPYGCPINTPDLAFKAEMRECIDLFRAGKRLKTWCPRDTPKRAAAELATPAASSSAGSH